jgi:prolyl-tRNA editing enzyme YbaK/EbsC (Cys-tRNA(Pro) deacylase)
MAKKVDNLVDDLARLKLVRKLVDEQIELRHKILRERLSKRSRKASKQIFMGVDYSILAIFRQSKRMDNDKLRKAIGEKKYDAFKTKIVESVEFKAVAHDLENETELTKQVVNSTVLSLVSQVA